MNIIYKLLFSGFIIILLMFFPISNAFSQWEKIALPAGFESSFLLDVQFLKTNPDYGWACGYDAVIMRTTDRGETWAGTRAKPYPLQLESIQFLNENVGYTSGTSLRTDDGWVLKSIDGGKSWTDVTPDFASIPDSLRSLWGCYFLDENIGVVLGGSCNYQIAYKTTNGGASWSRKVYAIRDTKFSDALLYEDGSGWAVSSGVLWSTSDYGDNWQPYATTGGRDWQEELTYLDGSFLLPFNYSCYGNQSDAGGARFISGSTIRQTDLGSAMFGAFLLSKESGWVCGSNASIYFTSDAGASWQLTDCGIENDDNLDDLWFIDDTLGFVVGEGIYRTARLEIAPPAIISSAAGPVCSGEVVELTTDRAYSYYEWSTGDTNRTIRVDTTGNYSVYAYNSKCDSGRANIYVQFKPSPDFELSSDAPGPLCEGDTARLEAAGDSLDFTWSNGSRSAAISVTESGTYEVTGTAPNGCSASKEITILFNPVPEPYIEASKSTTFCIGDSVELATLPNMAAYRWYRKESGKLVSTERTINVKDSGTYFVEVTSDSGCAAASDEILVNVRLDTNQLQYFSTAGGEILDFGGVIFPAVACESITIKNISGRRAEIDHLMLDWNISFSIPPSQFPISLLPGEEADVEICYTPRKIATERDTMTLPDNCSPHILPLVATGEGMTYFADTDCDVEASFKTVGLDGKEFYYVSAPFPNPASESFRISYVIFSKNRSPIVPLTTLYDVLGRPIQNRTPLSDDFIKINNKIKETDEGLLSTGDIMFDISGLKSGIYFILISSKVNSSSFPVIISK